MTYDYVKEALDFMSCASDVSDEGLCYVVLIKIVLCVTHTSLAAAKVAARRRRKHLRIVVYEGHVCGSRDRSTYRIENICHCMRYLTFLVHCIIKIMSLIILKFIIYNTVL